MTFKNKFSILNLVLYDCLHRILNTHASVFVCLNFLFDTEGSQNLSLIWHCSNVFIFIRSVFYLGYLLQMESNESVLCLFLLFYAFGSTMQRILCIYNYLKTKSQQASPILFSKPAFINKIIKLAKSNLTNGLLAIWPDASDYFL